MSGDPVLMVANPKIPLSKGSKFHLMGAGFEPGQKINILFTSENGSLSNVSWAIKPEPVPNDSGTWSTTFDCTRIISKKMVKEGVYVITVTDSEYNFLAHAPVAFYAK